jgi:hypothetical protein
MTRPKPSDLLPPGDWIALRDAPAVIERLHGIPGADSAPLIRRAVEKFPLAHNGFERLKGDKIEPVEGNRHLVLPHKLAGWSAQKQRWSFLPASTPGRSSKDWRAPKGMSMQAGDDEVRVHDWGLAEVDWEAGTVRGPMGRRLDIFIHWRNVIGWLGEMKRLGYLAATDQPIEPRAAAVERSKRRPTSEALERWFKQRVANWPARKPFPTEAADWLAAQRHFKINLNRKDFREERRKTTPEGWRRQGRRSKSAKVWPFNCAD